MQRDGIRRTGRRDVIATHLGVRARESHDVLDAERPSASDASRLGALMRVRMGP